MDEMKQKWFQVLSGPSQQPSSVNENGDNDNDSAKIKSDTRQYCNVSH